MSEGKGILVATPERWDEACFSVPAMRALVNARLATGILCRVEQSAFWKTVTNIPQIHYTGSARLGKLAADIGRGWDAALVWENGIAAKALAKSGIGKRLGPDEDKLGKLLTHPVVSKESPTEHRVRMYIEVCSQMGVAVNKPEYFMAAPLGIPAEPNTVLLCPGSDFGASHEWPLNRWQELAEELIEKGKKITVAGVVGGRKLGKILAGRLGSDADFFHAAPMEAALPLLAVHQLVISADGSLPHLAAHAGSTCVTLFGPNDSHWKRPLGKRHVVVKRHVECAPCLSTKCLLDGRCQAELEVERVLTAIPRSF